MTSGTCVGWKEESGYGFIRPSAGGADLFVHRRDLAVALCLAQFQRVEFEVATDARTGKRRATKVRVIDDVARRAGGFDAIAADNHFVLNHG